MLALFSCMEHKMDYFETIVNLDGSITKRDYTPEEIAQNETALLKVAQRNAEAETKATEKAALLAKLGITDDEAKLLLS